MDGKAQMLTDGPSEERGFVRTDKCSVCGDPFTYFYTVGRPRVHCSRTCKFRSKTIGSHRIKDHGGCMADGCARRATRVSFGLCEAHYMRNRRAGRLVKRPLAPRLTKEGYVLETIPGHPLANGTQVAQHRKVAYEEHGGVCPDCYWCGTAVKWKTCHIDHLNGIKSDNRTENLVVSCPRCNRARGAAWPFLTALPDDTLDALVRLVKQSRCSPAPLVDTHTQQVG